MEMTHSCQSTPSIPAQNSLLRGTEIKKGDRTDRKKVFGGGRWERWGCAPVLGRKTLAKVEC